MHDNVTDGRGATRAPKSEPRKKRARRTSDLRNQSAKISTITVVTYLIRINARV